jgi:antitoxin component HigA of HigAB toxin-antitoxin module
VRHTAATQWLRYTTGADLMYEGKAIETQCDYEAAIVRLSALMDEDGALGSGTEAELERLTLAIAAYERIKVEPPALDLIEANLFRLDQLGLEKGAPQRDTGSAAAD